MAVKESILQKSLTAHYLDENELIELLKTTPTDLGDAADLPTADAGNVGQAYLIKGIHYRSEEVSAGVYDWVTYDTSGQSLHYPDASGKPTLNGVPLNGTLTSASVGVASDTSLRTPITDPTSTSILIDDDNSITYENLAAALNTLFNIGNLPKYEMYNNPLLTSDGTIVRWEITHTCKTSKVIIQLFSVSGGILQTSSGLTGLVQSNKGTNLVCIEWNRASNVAANSYYVVLIG